MAVFNKINERRGLIVGAIVVALFLFIVSGEILNPSSVFNFTSKTVAKINGSSISRDDYSKVQLQVEGELKAQGRNPDQNTLFLQTWNQLIYNYGYEPQFDKLGLVVTPEEADALKEGKFVHTHVKSFYSALSGQQQYDPSIVPMFFQNFDNLSPEVQNYWKMLEYKLPQIRMHEKYVSLLKKTEYVTKQEARYNYIAQTEKAEVKVLYVPYYSVADTTIKVTDEMMNEYLSAHRSEYKVEDGVSIDYVVFDVKPSAKDTALIMNNLKIMKQGFTAATNDTAFVRENSNNPELPAWVSFTALPGQMSEESITPGNVYGPYSNANPSIPSLELYKVAAEKPDTANTLYVRAAHILVQSKKTDPQEMRDKAKAKIDAVYARAKAGEDFFALAKENSDDNSAASGGRLGWFAKERMVPEFGNACFSAKRTGLIPGIIETDYGYHLIYMMDLPQKGKQYLVAKVGQDVYASDETKDIFARQADDFRQVNDDTTKFYAAIKKDKLNKQTHVQLRKSERDINGVPNAREVVQWAFGEADINDVSKVFNIDNGSKYVVAVLKDKTEEGYAELKDKKDELRIKVLNQEKAKVIQAKLDKLGNKKALDVLAQEYGNGATVATEANLTLQSSYAPQVGYDPVALGRVFGMTPGTRTEIIQGETGVIIIEVVSITKAPEIADYTQYKTQVNQGRVNRDDASVDQAVNKLSDIEDYRYKFF